MDNAPDDFELFTSLRYDPKLLDENFNTEVSGVPSPYLLLPYHVDRLVKQASVFEWPSAEQTMSAPDVRETVKRLCDEAVEKESDAHKGLRVRS